MAIKEIIRKHYIEIIIVAVILLLFTGGLFIEAKSQFLKGDYTGKVETIMKVLLSFI